jgi:succinate dehydrogenase / fumarate reductase cytochrome b subunit
MSKSAILSSSIAKKYWMALTGLFLCLFLVGHLLGNLQLINPFHTKVEIQSSFNAYAYFMTHNIAIKIMSYLTYISILFHAIDGIMLTIQNKKARPVSYAYNNPSANSKWPARQMALLGSAIFIFIVMHMSNFWYVMKWDSKPMPLQKAYVKGQAQGQAETEQAFYVTHTDNFFPVKAFENSPMGEAQMVIENGTEFVNKQANIKMGEGYKDLYSLVLAFFGHDKSKEGFTKNSMALAAVLLYVLSMIVLSLHLMHGFSSAFQSLGVNHRKYTPYIKKFGFAFSIVVPALFALIPILLFLNK